MNPTICDHEAALLEAIQSGRWPEACDSDLRAHVAECAVCADVVLVAQAMERENEWAGAEVSVPAAGLVWWKAQLQARREAVRRASEPMAMVERAAAILGVVALAALGIWQWHWMRGWFSWFTQLPSADAFRSGGLWPADVAASLQNIGFLVLVSGVACLLLASTVLYFFFAEE